MIRFILAFLVLPSLLPAQINTSTLWLDEIASHKIREMSCKTVFIENGKTDTVWRSTALFSAEGLPVSTKSAGDIDNQHFTATQDTYYDSSGHISGSRSRFNGITTDSMAVISRSPQKSVSYHDGKKVLYEYHGDSITEKNFTNGDTVIHYAKLHPGPGRSRWDREYARSFDRTEISRNAEKHLDTCRYFKSGKCILMIVDSVDASGRPLHSDYYNYGDKNFYVFSMPYDERQELRIYAPISRKGKISCRIEYAYNQNGLICQAKTTLFRKKMQTIVEMYSYELF